MIHKEAWYLEIDEAPDARDVATMFWGELQTRDPQADLKLLEGNRLSLDLRGYVLVFQPVAEDQHKILRVEGEFEGVPEVAEEYGFIPGETVATEDIFRFVLDTTEETTWADQIASRGEGRSRFQVESKGASPKYLLPDKRSQGRPSKSKLEVRPFSPHFGVGPTYYGIIDTGRMSWLKDHEYETEAEAKRALAKCKSGKAPMEFRGF